MLFILSHIPCVILYTILNPFLFLLALIIIYVYGPYFIIYVHNIFWSYSLHKLLAFPRKPVTFSLIFPSWYPFPFITSFCHRLGTGTWDPVNYFGFVSRWWLMEEAEMVFSVVQQKHKVHITFKNNTYPCSNMQCTIINKGINCIF